MVRISSTSHTDGPREKGRERKNMYVRKFVHNIHGKKKKKKYVRTYPRRKNAKNKYTIDGKKKGMYIHRHLSSRKTNDQYGYLKHSTSILSIIKEKIITSHINNILINNLSHLNRIMPFLTK